MRFHIRFCARVILGLLSIWCLKLILTHFISTEKSKIEPWLLDDILDAPIQPSADGSIFFHEVDSITEDDIHLANLTAHMACAVESAALHNPNTGVFLIFSISTFSVKHYKNAIMNALLSYPNVHMRNLDIWEYTENTPVKEWFRTYEIFESKHKNIHLADFLRLVTLWRYGGTYLDLDVVVLHNLEKLPPNYGVALSDGMISTDVLNFAPMGIGHSIADFCLKHFQSHFNGESIHNNGRDLFKRVFLYLCDTTDVGKIFDLQKCQGFKVFPPDTFGAISWNQWNNFFNENKLEITNKRFNNSYIAELWNNPNEPRKHLVGNRNVYSILAKRNCPKVFASARDAFQKVKPL